jgi:hypothetical protein
MAAGSFYWVVHRTRSAAEAHGPAQLSLLVSPAEWGRGLSALIKASNRHKDVGLLVTNVGPASAAADAGIGRGDVLLRYDGVPLDHTDGLKRLESAAAQRETTRQVPLDAVRGERDMTFSVRPGLLGITVSPLLHRLNTARPSNRTDDAPDGAQRADESKAMIVHVPTELVPHVAFLTHCLQKPRNAQQRKHARALLTAAAPG